MSPCFEPLSVASRGLAVCTMNSALQELPLFLASSPISPCLACASLASLLLFLKYSQCISTAALTIHLHSEDSSSYPGSSPRYGLLPHFLEVSAQMSPPPKACPDHPKNTAPSPQTLSILSPHLDCLHSTKHHLTFSMFVGRFAHCRSLPIRM